MTFGAVKQSLMPSDRVGAWSTGAGAGGTNRLTRGAGLTGAVDSATGVFSCWFNIRAGTGWTTSTDAIEFIVNGDYTFALTFGGSSTANLLEILLANAGFSSFHRGGISVTPDRLFNRWNHLLASWDVSNAVSATLEAATRIYLNDQSVGTLTWSSSIGSAYTIDYTTTNWWTGNSNNNAITEWAEIYLLTGTYLDLNDPTLRRRFINSNLTPANLGLQGERPSGARPIIYQSAYAGGNIGITAASVNRGTDAATWTLSGTTNETTSTPSINANIWRGP